MTPRERVNDLLENHGCDPDPYENLRCAIEAAIQSAVEAEREACAREADERRGAPYASTLTAAAIRARKP